MMCNLVSYLSKGFKHIQNNWPEYRCNPVIMPFGKVHTMYTQVYPDIANIVIVDHATKLVAITTYILTTIVFGISLLL